MTELAALNIRITGDEKDLTAALNSAKGQLQSFGTAATKSGAATGGVSNAMGRLANVSRESRGQIQNVSYQLQDMVVQLQMGTRWTTVMAQQLPQLAGGFGAVGAAVGILAAVGFSALGLAMSGVTEKAQTVQERMDGLSEAVGRYVSALEASNMPTERLIEQYGRMAYWAQAALDAAAGADRLAALSALNTEVMALATTFGTFEGAVDGLIGSPLEQTLFNISEQLGITRVAALDVQKALERLAAARGPQEVADAAARARDALIRAGVAADSDLVRGLNNAVIAASRLSGAAEAVEVKVRSIVPALNAVESAAGSAAGAVGAIGNAAAASYGNVMALASALGAAAMERATLVADPSHIGKRPKAAPVGGIDMGVGFGGGGKGGGGGGGRDYASELEAFQQQLMTETELEIAQYAERQTLLKEFLDARVLTIQEYQSYMEQIKSDHEAKLGGIEAEAYQQRLSQTAGLFGQLAEIASVGGQKMAKAVAAAQAIEGTINAYGAAIKALNSPGLTLAGRFAAYASVLAAGLKGVAAIKSAGGVGGGGGAAVASPAPQVTQQRTANINFYGGFQPTQETIGMIASGLNDWLGDGGRLNVGAA